jgi:hypothetical protein
LAPTQLNRRPEHRGRPIDAIALRGLRRLEGRELFLVLLFEGATGAYAIGGLGRRLGGVCTRGREHGQGANQKQRAKREGVPHKAIRNSTFAPRFA